MKKLLVILLAIICTFTTVFIVGCDQPENPNNPSQEQGDGQTGNGGSNGEDNDNEGVETPGQIFSLSYL